MNYINSAYPKYLIVIAIIAFLIIDLSLCLMPPIARDALIHHLAIPKLWIMHGGFYDIPWAAYSYYPMNVELLYALALSLGNDVIPNCIHFSFAISTAFIIYFYLNRKINQVAGLLGALIFISTPVISKLSTMAYVDLGLVFFVTASVLGFLCWRDTEYKQHTGLLVASVAMGLALGTKYNALITWFFMTLSLIFIYSRDTGKQEAAIKYGAIFFLISLVIYSPWLIKNTILTGNPFYPLFPGILNTETSGDGGAYSLATGYSSLGMFKIREVIYGEGFWTTISIPLRMFFQGQDDIPRYFDGVLNPILILFVPFAFIKKDMKMEKLFFLYLSLFILLVSFFLDQIRIRYILPAIPFFVILTVMGLSNIVNWLEEKERLFRSICLAVLVIILLALLSFNAIYIYKYFLHIDPVRYLMQKESRNDFIARHDGSYQAMMFINKNTPENATVRLILLAGRGYYIDRVYREDRSMGMVVIQNMVDHASNEKKFQRYLGSLGSTHLLIRNRLFQQYLRDHFDAGKIQQLNMQMQHTLAKIYDDHEYAVFKVMNK